MQASLPFVAENDCEVVGVHILNRYNNLRKNHVGFITIMVDSNYQSKGIGTLLMKNLGLLKKEFKNIQH
ncbi:MAG: GNAT family N-acetyltransferase [Clostridium sp.]|uniref:GNAT family N-acetyltransferase n=1 Tax=Clostridium sp. TaxID=1506 RepID=UPI003EE432C6